MEKKIKFENVVNFIRKSIENKYHIYVGYNILTISHKKEYITPDGGTQYYNCFSFWWETDKDALLITVGSSCYNKGFNYILKVENPKDKARWNILIEDVKEYTFTDVENRFDSFFDEEDSKPTTINDLDNEDD